jgi:hypothetical protein
VGGLAAALECALGRACVERDAEYAHAEAAQQDYRDRLRGFTSSSNHSINFSWMLEESQILLSQHKTDLKVC